MMNERLRAILDTYLSQEGDSIRYIISFYYSAVAVGRVRLDIRYIDNGGNYHHIGFNEHGMVTFE